MISPYQSILITAEMTLVLHTIFGKDNIGTTQYIVEMTSLIHIINSVLHLLDCWDDISTIHNIQIWLHQYYT